MYAISHSCRGVPSRDTRNQFLLLRSSRCWVNQPGRRCVRKPGWITPQVPACYTTIRRRSSRRREASVFAVGSRFEGEEDRGMSLDFFLKIGPRLTPSRSGLKNAGFFNLVNRIFRSTVRQTQTDKYICLVCATTKVDVEVVLLRPPFGSPRIKILFGGGGAATLKHCEEDLG